MARKTRRNLGFVGRVAAPIRSALGVVTGALTDGLNAVKGAVGIAGYTTSRIVGRVANGANNAVRRVVTGKRQAGGKRRSRRGSRKSRKSGKSRR